MSDLLEAWKVPIFVNNETYYKFKEKEKARLCRGKRTLEDYDQTILTPDRKKVKLDPRALFDKVSILPFLTTDIDFVIADVSRLNYSLI